MQPLTLNAADVSMWVSRMWWPALRVGGFVLAAPIASEGVVPGLVKIVLTLALAFLLGPLIPVPAGLSIFSGAGLLTAALELLIGVAIGMVVQVTFEALVFAGQSISLTMGLGFATLVDPQRGAQVPVLGQLFMIFGTLTYLAINGHLMLLGALVESFHTLPIGAHLNPNFFLSLVLWGAHVFDTGLLDRAAGRHCAGDRQSRAGRRHPRRAAAQFIRDRFHHHAHERLLRAARRTRRHHVGHRHSH